VNRRFFRYCREACRGAINIAPPKSVFNDVKTLSPLLSSLSDLCLPLTDNKGDSVFTTVGHRFFWGKFTVPQQVVIRDESARRVRVSEGE
jgi:hypothetical protein